MPARVDLRGARFGRLTILERDERPMGFSEIAARLWGYGWQTKAARHFEVTDRTVRRWVAGTSDIPESVMAELRAMVDIAPPPGSSSSDDRDEACIDAIEPALTDLRNRALGAGWHPAEVAAAVLSLTISEIRESAGKEAAHEILVQALGQMD